ncbi:hypothetical protein ACP214_11550 [Staphylococcus epidermidis]
MKKWIYLLTCISLLLAGCSFNKHTNEKTKQPSTQTTQRDHDQKHMNQTHFSDYIQSKKNHIFYELNTTQMSSTPLPIKGSGSIKNGFSINNNDDQELFKEMELKNVIATKNGQTRHFNIDLREDESYTFDNFSKYNESEVLKKVEHIEHNLLEDLNTEKPSTYVDPIQILMTQDNQNKGINISFDHQHTPSQIKEDLKTAPFNHAIDYNTSIKPFKYHGKYFAGLAKVTYHSTSEGYILQKLLITEVKDNHTMITIDNDKDFDDAHTMSYEATENGQDKKEKEDKDIDHL